MVWMLLAGVVVFLLGMQMIEEVLRNSAGRSFKLFLRKHTSSKPKAVLGGALVTALLQGSSTVNMMVLAFSGAGVLPLENALAIVLGSNVGTTLDSWIVASLGFSLVGQTLPYALTAMAGIGIFFFKEGARWKPVFRFFLGLGLLFIGLDLMKTSMSGVIETEWIQQLVHYPVWVYVFAGVVVTAVIQSSFAMVALTLSALFTGALEFTQAAALVLGAEVGTTLKFFIASLDGHPVKKQLALGNFIMNVVTAVLILIFLLPITDFIQIGFGFTNELLALVTFQSLVNVVSLICFFPFLRTFSSFLQRRYTIQKVETHYIQNILPTETEQALPALENETRDFLKGVLFFIQHHFKLVAEEGYPSDTNERFRGKRLEDQYAYFKRLYGDIHHYYRQTRGALSAMADLDRADQLMAAVRNGMYAAKNMKDAQGDILLLQNSSNDFKYNYFLKARERSRHFCELLLAQLETESGPQTFDRLRAMYDDIVKGYGDELSALYHQSVPVQLHDTDLSTIVNFNRELYTGYKSMLLSAKDFLLDKSHADQFDELPGFIR